MDLNSIKIYNILKSELKKGVGKLLNKIKDAFSSKQLICTNCGRKIEEGERFIATITMPSEKDILVGRLDNTIARTANSVVCERCQ